MGGPLPKDPRIRRGHHKPAVTAAKLKAAPRDREVPTLQPADRDWHPRTVAWWAEVWASPMAAEFLDVDVHALFILAVLIDRFWTAPSAGLAAEIRLQRQSFGLTPLDRRRLEWTVERLETSRRHAVEPKPEGPKRRRGADPRLALVGTPKGPGKPA